MAPTTAGSSPQFGPSARGIAVVEPSVSSDELHAHGVRGIGFNLTQPGGPGRDAIVPLAERIAELGWHLEINMSPDDVATSRHILTRLPTGVVLDHMARLSGPSGLTHPAFEMIAGILVTDKAWVKLSGPYIASQSGPPANEDRSAVAREFVRIALRGLAWGSDRVH
jgi:D-galactarolactone isomerase